MPRVLAATVALVLASSIALEARQAGRFARATFTEVAPTIDGVVDDAAWEQAEPITDFIQTDPIQGSPASEETVVRILYDNRAVYIGVILYDSEPDEILVTDSRRDASLGNTDSFQIIFDTYHDRQNGFVFGTNPAGIEYDGQVSNEGRGGGGGGRGTTQVGSGSGFNKNWDASWTVRTSINELGWMAEFEIPLRSLRYGDKPQTWGINFQRNIRRKREQVFWAPIERIYNLYRLSSAGELQGLELETPRNFKLTPYVVASAVRNFANVEETEADFDADGGFDLKFGVTPSLNLDVTYNTDFAQVEVDEQVINLTRFNVRFPEKRPFFLENAGLFAAGKSGVDLFFSRSIGIDRSSRSEVPIIGGARLSGKVGAFNLGLLSMQTDDVPGITAKNNYTVGRLSRELPNRSSLGGIVASREATGKLALSDDWNRTWGFDGRLGIAQYTDFRGFVARTETPGVTAGESAYNIRGEYKRVGGDFHVEYTEVDDDFNPEIGFLTRPDGYRNTDIGFFIRKRMPQPWLRELRPHASVRTFWDLDGFKETETIHIDSHIDFESGWYISPAFDIEYEGLKEPFEIADGVVIPAGTYRNLEAEWRFNTDQSRALSLASGMTVGGFYTGNQRSFNHTVAVRRGANLNASLSWRRNDINLPEGEFVSNLVQARFNYSFTPLINFQSLVQYNTSARNWSGNFRLGWQNTAGTGLFVVYNETQRLEGLGPINRTFVVKYSRQFDVLR